MWLHLLLGLEKGEIRCNYYASKAYQVAFLGHPLPRVPACFVPHPPYRMGDSDPTCSPLKCPYMAPAWRPSLTSEQAVWGAASGAARDVPAPAGHVRQAVHQGHLGPWEVRIAGVGIGQVGACGNNIVSAKLCIKAIWEFGR